MAKTRVLIIDDSASIRRLIRARVGDDARLVVVGEAADAYEARDKIKALAPDVLTLDVEMPRMNGLDFLERLMRLRPMPVVMISSETSRGSAAALASLALGAVDCVRKPWPGMPGEAFSGLAELLVAAAGARLRDPGSRAPITPPGSFRWNGRIVLIGASTGGVEALDTVLSGFPENCPPVLIAQHMPASFLASFANRLDARIPPRLQLATDGRPLLQGHVYLAPGGETHLCLGSGSFPVCRLIEAAKRAGHRPSVDHLFESAVPVASNVVAVILTGMGRDGAAGMRALRSAGATCRAQDKASSTIFGMPKAALENGGAERAVPLCELAGEILALTSDRRPARHVAQS